MKNFPIHVSPGLVSSAALMSPALPSICQTFRNLARWTWTKLDSADKCGVSFGEETITESLLLKLAELHKNNIAIRAYTKAEEGIGTKATGYLPTGADWSFWFVSSSGLGIELRIQAKRQFSDGKYRNLDGFGPQIVDLWNNRGAAIPLYVLYNGPFKHDKAGSGWSNFSCGAQCEKFFRGQTSWGCSFAGVNRIPAKSAPYPAEIVDMRPLHCLVCKCHNSAGGGLSLPEKICCSANSLYKPGNGISKSIFSEIDKPFEPHRDSPDWVSLLEAKDLNDEELQGFWSRTDLKGVAIIREIANKPDGE